MDQPILDEQKATGIDKKARVLTLWSTSFSTLQVTTTSYITGTTVSILLLCRIDNIFNNNSSFCESAGK